MASKDFLIRLSVVFKKFGLISFISPYRFCGASCPKVHLANLSMAR